MVGAALTDMTACSPARPQCPGPVQARLFSASRPQRWLILQQAVSPAVPLQLIMLSCCAITTPYPRWKFPHYRAVVYISPGNSYAPALVPGPGLRAALPNTLAATAETHEHSRSNVAAQCLHHPSLSCCYQLPLPLANHQPTTRPLLWPSISGFQPSRLLCPLYV
jgi:hypothetical protein